MKTSEQAAPLPVGGGCSHTHSPALFLICLS
uniref:Uncharacterized protein n=1 Tax=Anguilla anguilla TaxID=7936 RepID=A0A0E9SKR0_ANGAN